MTKHVHIRPMHADDLTGSARIVAETELWRVHYGVTRPQAEAMFREALNEGDALYVAVAEGEVVGFIWYLLRGAFHRSGYIRLIGVREDHRGQGIGAALLRQAELQMFAHADHVFLLVSHFNHAAQDFYRRWGYKQVGAIPDYVVLGITELIFCKGSGTRDLSESAAHA